MLLKIASVALVDLAHSGANDTRRAELSARLWLATSRDIPRCVCGRPAQTGERYCYSCAQAAAEMKMEQAA